MLHNEGIIATLVLLCACANGAPKPVCYNGEPDFPLPSSYGFQQENWACDNNAVSTTFKIDVDSFVSTFGTLSQGFDSDLVVAEQQLLTEVWTPAIAAWTSAGANTLFAHTFVHIDPISIPDVMAERGDGSYIVARAGKFSGTATIAEAGAVTTHHTYSSNEHQIVECDIVIFSQGVDEDKNVVTPYYQRTSLGFGPLYSYVIAHEMGHCLGFLDQAQEWGAVKGEGYTDSLMWWIAQHNVPPEASSEDQDALLHLYGI